MDSSLAMAAHRGLCYDEYEPFVSDGTEATIVSEEKKGVCEYQLNYASTITGGRNAIKNKIKELGGVMVSYYADDLYMTFDNKSYYDPETTKYSGINHAVSVVGWDDNYSKSNFLAGYQPKKNGAWLVKGSWGVSSGTDGYYWISYEEAEMTDWVAFDLTESCDNNYHYPANKDNSIFYVSNENKMSGADVFTAKKDELLDKVGFMYLGYTGKSDYTVQVYTSVSDSTPVGILECEVSGKVITQKITVKYGSKTLKNGTDYTVKYSANTKVGTAKVTITGKGIYGGVIIKSFAIYPAKQVIQKLYGTYAGFFVDYAQKGSATGYEISYSQRSDFKGAKSVKVTNNRTDKKTVSGLARYQKYYVRVRSYTVKGGKTYNGAWSDKKWVYTQ